MAAYLTEREEWEGQRQKPYNEKPGNMQGPAMKHIIGNVKELMPHFVRSRVSIYLVGVPWISERYWCVDEKISGNISAMSQEVFQSAKVAG